jgi:hypothetical protein
VGLSFSPGLDSEFVENGDELSRRHRKADHEADVEWCHQSAAIKDTGLQEAHVLLASGVTPYSGCSSFNLLSIVDVIFVRGTNPLGLALVP